MTPGPWRQRLAALLAAAGLPWAACAQPSAHALLIGIGDYGGVPHVGMLNGPRNDVMLMKSVLQERLSMPQERIEVLVDAQATHTRLRDAFARLAARISPGDFVYIHYAGHGSYAPDARDPLGMDQTWIPHGARRGKLAGEDDRDIRDKEIAQWLRPIHAKTTRLVFVSDSCHSGTVSRGPSAQRLRGVREAPPDARPLAPLPPIELAGETPGVKVGAAEDIAAALEFDPHTGKDCEDASRCHGVFTWYWAQSLMRARPGQTWQDIHARTYALVSALPGYAQRPQLSGPAGWPVLGGTAAAQPATAVTAVDHAAGSVRLGAGALLGVTVGSTYEGVGRPAPGQPQPRLEITAVEPFSSTARVTAGRFDVGDAVRELRHVHDMPPIRLGVDGDLARGKDGALVERLRAATVGLPGYLAADPAGADLLLQVLRPRCTATGCEHDRQRPRLPRSFDDQPPEVWLTTRQDEPVGGVHRWPLADEAAALAALRQRLDGVARAAALERLQSPPDAPRPVQVQAVHLRADPGCAAACVYLPRDRERRSPMRVLAVHELPVARIEAQVGDALTFRLANLDPVDDWHVYLLDIDRTAGRPQPIFPARGENDGAARLESGKPARDLGAVTAFRLTSPGVNVVKVVATLQPLSMALLDAHHWHETARGGADPIAPLLADEGRRSAAAPPAWSTFQSEVVIRAAASGQPQER